MFQILIIQIIEVILSQNKHKSDSHGVYRYVNLKIVRKYSSYCLIYNKC